MLHSRGLRTKVHLGPAQRCNRAENRRTAGFPAAVLPLKHPSLYTTRTLELAMLHRTSKRAALCRPRPNSHSPDRMTKSKVILQSLRQHLRLVHTANFLYDQPMANLLMRDSTAAYKLDRKDLALRLANLLVKTHLPSLSRHFCDKVMLILLTRRPTKNMAVNFLGEMINAFPNHKTLNLEMATSLLTNLVNGQPNHDVNTLLTRKVFTVIQISNMEPTKEIFDLLIASAVAQKSINRFDEYNGFMLKLYRPSLYNLKMHVSLLKKMYEPEVLLNVIAEYEERYLIKPDYQIWEDALYAVSKAFKVYDLEFVENYFEKLSKAFRPRNKAYDCLITACGRHKNLLHMKKWVEHMDSLDIPLSRRIMDAVSHTVALVKDRTPEYAWLVNRVKGIEISLSDTTKANVELIYMLSEKKPWKNYFAQMLKDNHVMTKTYYRVLNVCVETGDGNSALQIFKLMCDNGIVPTAVVFCQVIKVAGMSKIPWVEVKNIYRKMIEYQVYPDPGVMVEITRACARYREPENMSEFVDIICNAKSPYSQEQYQGLLLGFSQTSDQILPSNTLSSIRILESMLKWKCFPSQILFSRMVIAVGKYNNESLSQLINVLVRCNFPNEVAQYLQMLLPLIITRIDKVKSPLYFIKLQTPASQVFLDFKESVEGLAKLANWVELQRLWEHIVLASKTRISPEFASLFMECIGIQCSDMGYARRMWIQITQYKVYDFETSVFKGVSDDESFRWTWVKCLIWAGETNEAVRFVASSSHVISSIHQQVLDDWMKSNRVTGLLS